MVHSDPDELRKQLREQQAQERFDNGVQQESVENDGAPNNDSQNPSHKLQDDLRVVPSAETPKLKR